VHSAESDLHPDGILARVLSDGAVRAADGAEGPSGNAIDALFRLVGYRRARPYEVVVTMHI
jgi:hypothetical protein